MSHENQIIGQTPTPEVFYDYDQESTRRGSNGKLAVLVAGALSLVGCGANTVGADTDSDRPDPVVTTTADIPSTTLDAPVVVTTEAPQPETTIGFNEYRERDVIKMRDIRGMIVEDRHFEGMSQSEVEALLERYSDNVSYGLNSDGPNMAHALLMYNSEKAVRSIENLRANRQLMDDIKMDIPSYKFGVRYESRGEAWIEDDILLVPVTEYVNNVGSMRDDEWEAASTSIARFQPSEVEVLTAEGIVAITIWQDIGAQPGSFNSLG